MSARVETFLGEWARFGRPCLVEDRHQPGRRYRGRFVRELNQGQLIEVVLDGRRFPEETTRAQASEIRELANEENLFPEGTPRLDRRSALAEGVRA